MTDAQLTDIRVILDRSGSMATIRKDMEGGFDHFIAEQRNATGTVRVSLYQFDSVYETVYENKSLAEVPPCAIDPRGSTALLDAIGTTIVRTGDQLAALEEAQRPGLVVVVIVTDGLENASREYNHHQINDMITRQRDEYSWMFVYLGANQDAIATAASMGIDRRSALTYAGGVGGQSAYVSAGRMVTNTSAGVRSGMSASAAVADFADFTDEDRSQAVQQTEKESEKK